MSEVEDEEVASKDCHLTRRVGSASRREDRERKLCIRYDDASSAVTSTALDRCPPAYEEGRLIAHGSLLRRTCFQSTVSSTRHRRRDWIKGGNCTGFVYELRTRYWPNVSGGTRAMPAGCHRGASVFVDMIGSGGRVLGIIERSMRRISPLHLVTRSLHATRASTFAAQDNNPGGVTASRLRCMALAIVWITLGTVDGFNVFWSPRMMTFS